MVGIRNAVEAGLYRHIFKPMAFRLDPEQVHDQIVSLGEWLGQHPVGRGLTQACFDYQHPLLATRLGSLHLRNPIGLAAGFDKNARLTQILPAVGFGFMEIGSVTARPCAGNPKPRLYRLPKSQALVVNYGLMNDGCEAIAHRLAEQDLLIPVGTSIAPTNDFQTADYEAAIEDYTISYRELTDIGQYTTLNLSCPNTTQDRPFMEPKKLARLLKSVSAIPSVKPIYLKLSPDTQPETLADIITVAIAHKVEGLIISNLTKNRTNPEVKQRLSDTIIPAAGGISGKVVAPLADEMIARARKLAHDKLVIIGCGGVFTAQDAYRKIRLGANAIQLATGMIFGGPQTISSINSGIVKLLKQDGCTNLEQIVGIDTE